MNGLPESSGKTKGRGASVVIGVVLLVVAVVAVLVGKGVISIPGLPSGDGRGGGNLTDVSAVIGSEKREFFEDPDVVSVFADHGYRVGVETAGSRRIATDTDLDSVDLVFPSSGPAAQKVVQTAGHSELFTPFYSPIAVATFGPILDLLQGEGVASRRDGHWFIDMNAYLGLAERGARWRDLGDTFPSPRVVQFSSTDVRASNSAAMYLSILAWVANNDSVVVDDAQISAVLDKVTPLFLGQGYTESTSAGPFADYLSQGMGSKPMVMVYESQFLAARSTENSRVSGDMVLAYPSPTVLSTHTAVGLTDTGSDVGRLLVEDPELQRLAARHGFRPQNPSLFDEEMADQDVPSYLDSIDPPDYDNLEKLIEGVGSSYNSPPPPEHVEEQ